MLLTSTRLLFVSLVALTCFAAFSSGLKCHQCASNRNSDCWDAAENGKFLLPCNDTHNACRVTYQTVESKDRVIRQCATVNKDIFYCIDRVGTKSVKVKFCHCQEEGCNLAVTSSSSSYILLFVSLLATTFFYSSH